MSEHGLFWDDLNRELEDPEVAADFAANQATIQALDSAVNERIASIDPAPDGATLTAHRDGNGVLYIDSTDIRRNVIRAWRQPEDAAPVSSGPADAPPNGCRWCGNLEREHAEWHPYVAPTDALRLARMKVRRSMRLDPPRRAELTPDLIVEFQVNTGVFTAAMVRAMEGLSDAARQMGEAARPVVESIRRRQLIAAVNRRADERIAAWRARQESTPEGTIDWGEPLEDSDADWPARGAVNEVCAHVCGGGPDHACAARADTFLQYTLPSAGTRTMPICQPCFNAETAEVAHA